MYTQSKSMVNQKNYQLFLPEFINYFSEHPANIVSFISWQQTASKDFLSFNQMDSFYNGSYIN